LAITPDVPILTLARRFSALVRRWYPRGCGVIVGLLLTGCETVEKYSLTYRLWDNEDLRKWSEPAPNPNLALFEATNHADVLIQYDAFSEKRAAVMRHSYYLHLNQARIEAGTKPALLKPSAADGLKPIPVLPGPGTLTNQALGLPAYATVTREGRAFTLVHPPEPPTTFDLPVYADTSGTPTRAALTPFAVVGDTVMVCLVSSVVAFFLWLEMGAPH
jgi:hypothetical protein